MISEPVFDDPKSLESNLQRATLKLSRGERIPNKVLAAIIEKTNGAALPAFISDYLVKHFSGELKGKKGPKLQSAAIKDFRFGPAAVMYEHVLPVFQYLKKRQGRLPTKSRRSISGKGHKDQTLDPRTRALEYVREKMRKERVNLGTNLTLANEISKWRKNIDAVEFPDDDPNRHPTDP